MRARKIVLFVAAVAALVGGLGAEIPTASAAPNPLGEFTSLIPTRILDTRDGNGTHVIGPVGAGQSRDIRVTGRGGVPASGVSAVVLNTTVVQYSSGSYLTVWPTGEVGQPSERPLISNLNPNQGEAVANQVTVKVGAGGQVSIFNALGEADVIFDVAGYYSDSTGPNGARFKPLDPTRLLDTRNSGGPLGPGGYRVEQVANAGVPSTGVTAVVMNLTATDASAYTYVTAYPSDKPRPLASSLNLGPASIRGNLVTVQVPENGLFTLYNAAGSVNLIADVVGYYTTEITTEEGRFIPVDPVRAYDTRDDDWPVGEDETFTLYFGENPGISAMALNVTATEASEGTFVTVFPHDACARPLASNLNLGPFQTRPNAVATRVSDLSDGIGCDSEDTAFSLYNAKGQVHLVIDLFGIFTDAGGSAAARSADAGFELPDLSDLKAERVA